MCHFKETAKAPKSFLVQFSGQSLLVLFLIGCLEKIAYAFCKIFILPDEFNGESSERKLIIAMTDNKHGGLKDPPV